MKNKFLNIVDDMALSRLETGLSGSERTPSHTQWIRILRNRLRMSQEELAKRANITQPHLAGIETGKIDPRISTLRQIFHGLSCDLIIEPRPQKPLDELLRGQARSLALKRLKRTMGTMALEGQAPEEQTFRHLLEKRTDDILLDHRERLWQKKDD
jgi:predicted DNA-binding mobile mystery protein A